MILLTSPLRKILRWSVRMLKSKHSNKMPTSRALPRTAGSTQNHSWLQRLAGLATQINNHSILKFPTKSAALIHTHIWGWKCCRRCQTASVWRPRHHRRGGGPTPPRCCRHSRWEPSPASSAQPRRTCCLLPHLHYRGSQLQIKR